MSQLRERYRLKPGICLAASARQQSKRCCQRSNIQSPTPVRAHCHLRSPRDTRLRSQTPKVGRSRDQESSARLTIESARGRLSCPTHHKAVHRRIIQPEIAGSWKRRALPHVARGYNRVDADSRNWLVCARHHHVCVGRQRLQHGHTPTHVSGLCERVRTSSDRVRTVGAQRPCRRSNAALRRGSRVRARGARCVRAKSRCYDRTLSDGAGRDRGREYVPHGGAVPLAARARANGTGIERVCDAGE